MAFKLKIGAFMDAPFGFVVRDGSRDVAFTCTLVLRRLSQTEATEALGEIGKLAATEGTTPGEFSAAARALILDLVHDWRDQRLVLDDEDKPAPYSREAMGAMLDVVGMEGIVLNAVVKAVNTAAREEARDRRGN